MGLKVLLISVNLEVTIGGMVDIYLVPFNVCARSNTEFAKKDSKERLMEERIARLS